jgi:ribosomal protein S27AE
MECEITDKDGRYYANRNCPICGDKITHSTDGKQKNAKYYLIRNIKTATKKNKKCHKCTVISQTGDGNPFAGKKHSETTLKKISINRKGKGCGKNNSMNKPEVKDKWVKKTTKYRLKSKTELYIYNKLKNTFPDIISTFYILTKPFDYYIPSKKLLIEYNGDYFHCNPTMYDDNYFNKKLNKTAKELWGKDKEKTLLGESKGYKVLTLWEKDYKEKGFDFILNEIKKY